MQKKIQEVFKAKRLSWGKFAEILNGGDRSSLKVKVEGWANKLNQAFNKIGYEVVFKKIDDTRKDSDNT